MSPPVISRTVADRSSPERQVDHPNRLDRCISPIAGRRGKPSLPPSGQETIAAADEHGMAMIFTGMRHFRH